VLKFSLQIIAINVIILDVLLFSVFVKRSGLKATEKT
jgi:hypothetical protein